MRTGSLGSHAGSHTSILRVLARGVFVLHFIDDEVLGCAESDSEGTTVRAR